MKKMLSILILMVFSIMTFISSTKASNDDDKVFLFHCTNPKNIETILKEGLKSKKQLKAEEISVDNTTKGTNPTSLLPDQDDVVYFQYLDHETFMEKIGPCLWQMKHGFGSKQCVAIAVNPDDIRIHNGELRAARGITPDEKITSQESRQKAYNRSAMTLRQYMQIIQNKENAPGVGVLIHDPYTAEPLRTHQHNQYANYFPEYTVPNRVDANEFVQ